MLYIYKILSRNNSDKRISFYLPWIGLFIGTIFLILVNSIMIGMEREIFLKLEDIDNGYKIYPISTNNMNEVQNFLEKNNIDYVNQKTQDVLIGTADNYLFAKLIIREEFKDSSLLKVGVGISRKLGVDRGDEINILSPLDAKLTTMKFPTKKISISSIYRVPVLDFDNLYIFSNDLNFSKELNGLESLIIKKSINKNKIKLIKDAFPQIRITPWLDDYSTLISAIDLEKSMYKAFAYLLIVISSLGLFTTTNYTIINKKRSILSIYNLGYSFNKLRKDSYLLMALFSLISTIGATILTYLLIYLNILNPLLDRLFPQEVFYDFNLTIDFLDAMYILIINTVVVLFSVYIPLKSIHSSINIKDHF